MKEYYISRTGGEFSFSYTINASKTLTWQVTGDTTWFTWSASNGVLKVSCGAVEGLTKKSITLVPLINGSACGGMIVSQMGSNVVCDCDAIRLDKSSDYYYRYPISYTGGSFEYEYSFETCAGEKNVTFQKVNTESWYTIDHNVGAQKLTVSVDNAGSRTSLQGGIYLKVNNDNCTTIDFKQEPTPLPTCGCATLSFNEVLDYYATHPIPDTGGSFTYTYNFAECSGSNVVSFAKTDSSKTYFNFTHDATNHTLTVTVDAVGSRTGSNLDGAITCSVNGVSCSTITFSQHLPTCGCATLSFDKAVDHYVNNPLPSTGASFTYQYNFAQCEGNKDIVFTKTDSSKSYFTFTHDATNRTLTVTVDAVGSRTGSNLDGAITCSVNGLTCSTITFRQELPTCGCETLSFNEALDYYEIHPVPDTGGSFTYTYNFAECSGNKSVSFAKTDSSKTYFNFTHNATNRTLTVTVDAIGSRTGSNLDGAITCSVNGLTCSTITFSQHLPTCGCETLSFNKALDYYVSNPISSTGGSFTYQYNFVECEGNKDIAFTKTDSTQNFFSISHNPSTKTLSVTVNAVGSRSGSDVSGSITCTVNGVTCALITFMQDLVDCSCSTITFDKAFDYYATAPNLIPSTGGTYEYNYTLAPCKGEMNVSFTKSTSETYYSFTHNTSLKKLTFTVNDAGTRTGASLLGGFKIYINNIECSNQIRFAQEETPLPECNCDDLTITRT